MSTMTPERFGGKDYDGVIVQAIGDDGESFVALGHVEPEAMARATTRAIADVHSFDPDPAIEPSGVRHLWAVELPPVGLAEWVISWGVGPDADRAFPVSVVDVNL